MNKLQIEIFSGTASLPDRIVRRMFSKDIFELANIEDIEFLNTVYSSVKEKFSYFSNKSKTKKIYIINNFILKILLDRPVLNFSRFFIPVAPIALSRCALLVAPDTGVTSVESLGSSKAPLRLAHPGSFGTIGMHSNFYTSEVAPFNDKLEFILENIKSDTYGYEHSEIDIKLATSLHEHIVGGRGANTIAISRPNQFELDMGINLMGSHANDTSMENWLYLFVDESWSTDERKKLSAATLRACDKCFDLREMVASGYERPTIGTADMLSVFNAQSLGNIMFYVDEVSSDNFQMFGRQNFSQNLLRYSFNSLDRTPQRFDQASPHAPSYIKPDPQHVKVGVEGPDQVKIKLGAPAGGGLGGIDKRYINSGGGDKLNKSDEVEEGANKKYTQEEKDGIGSTIGQAIKSWFKIKKDAKEEKDFIEKEWCAANPGLGNCPKPPKIED